MDAGTTDEHRDPHSVIVDVELAGRQIVLTHVVSMVAREEEIRRAPQAKLLQSASDLSKSTHQSQATADCLWTYLQSVGNPRHCVVHRHQRHPTLAELTVNCVPLMRHEMPLPRDHRMMPREHRRLHAERFRPRSFDLRSRIVDPRATLIPTPGDKSISLPCLLGSLCLGVLSSVGCASLSFY